METFPPPCSAGEANVHSGHISPIDSTISGTMDTISSVISNDTSPSYIPEQKEFMYIFFHIFPNKRKQWTYCLPPHIPQQKNDMDTTPPMFPNWKSQWTHIISILQQEEFTDISVNISSPTHILPQKELMDTSSLYIPQEEETMDTPLRHIPQ